MKDLQVGAGELDKGDYPAAQKSFDSAIKAGDLKGDALALAYSLRGLSLWAQDKNDAALQDLNKAMELASTGGQVWGDNLERRCQLQLAMKRHREAAADFLTLVQWNPNLVKSMSFDRVARLIWSVQAVDEGLTFDLLTALRKISYRPQGPGDSLDALMGLYARLLVQRGDKAKALAELAQITSAGVLITARVDRRLEPIWRDPVFERATNPSEIAQRDLKVKEQTFQKFPNFAAVIRDYVAALRVAGDGDKAIAIAKAALANPSALKIEDEGSELWLRNELVYALKDAGRIEEMLAEMDVVLNIDPAKNGYVVSQFINYAEIKMALGRNAEAIALAKRAWDRSSPYGKMFVQGITLCSSVDTDPGLVERTLGEMRAKTEENYAAMTLALLCANRLDEIAALIKKRLSLPDQRSGVLEAAQHYRSPKFVPPAQKLWIDRYQSVINRPDVKAEIEKYGRVETFPFVSEYWGNV